MLWAINYVIADRVEGSPQRLQYRGVVWQYDYSIPVVVVVVGGWVVIIRLMCYFCNLRVILQKGPKDITILHRGGQAQMITVLHM